MSNTINITRCDNEIIILAFYNSAEAEGSYEVCRILNGYQHPLNVTLSLSAGASFSGTVNLNGVTTPIGPVTQTVTIPSGSYNLLLLGINWGGGQEYKININGNDYGIYPYEPDGAIGLPYHSQPIAITV